jgi:hypothetical protein
MLIIINLNHSEPNPKKQPFNKAIINGEQEISIASIFYSNHALNDDLIINMMIFCAKASVSSSHR